MTVKTIKLKSLAFYLLTTYSFAGVGILLGGDTGEIYKSLSKPAFSPPGIAFPIAWSILYTIMAISAYLLAQNQKTKGLVRWYWAQLVINALWPFAFWRAEAFILAAVMIVAMLAVNIYISFSAYKEAKAAVYMLIPYILWLIFALYLNIGIAFLN